jgi:MoxR-like ATPase
VLATQNPVEYEGTYPLPEAELDRFLFKALVRYPASGEEVAILRSHDGGRNPRDALDSLEPLADGALDAARREVDATTVADDVVRYVVSIVEASRKSPDLHLGASPRAGVHLLRAAKANAAIDGRDFVTPDDIKALAAPVLRHRFVLKPEAEIEGLDADGVVGRILSRVEVPR